MSDKTDLWKILKSAGLHVASEDEYAHGYQGQSKRDFARYVTFRMGNEYYGLPIPQIVEISKQFSLTPVPRASEFVLGIGNIRGIVLPVIDLPTRLGIGVAENSARSRILIATYDGEQYGLLVDEVMEVHELASNQLEDPPGGIGNTRVEFIQSLGRYRGRILVVLDLETVLAERAFVASRYLSSVVADQEVA